jgi:hypothetical protein
VEGAQVASRGDSGSADVGAGCIMTPIAITAVSSSVSAA